MIRPIYKLTKDTLQKIFRYGFTGLLVNVFALILYNSDRYFIALYFDIDSVGIYNQNYIIAQTAISAITMAFFNSISPDFNHCLTVDIKNSAAFISKKMFSYILLMAPITIILSLFAFEFNYFLLGQKFHSGYPIISYVTVSLFLFGWTTFSETKLKFANRLWTVIIGFSSACIINVSLNLFFLRKFDYSWAAVTTLIAFVFLFIYFIILDRESYHEFIRSYYNDLIILTFTLVIILILNKWLESQLSDYTRVTSSLIKFIIYSVLLGAVLLFLLFRKETLKKK